MMTPHWRFPGGVGNTHGAERPHVNESRERGW
jgi:hypothetical protein